MAFELQMGESVEAGVRRIVDEQLQDALDELRGADPRKADAAVHAARKRFKRIRSLVRLVRTTYALLGLISFFTVGEDECRAWTIPVHTRAVEAAGAIHSDLEKHFIRAETIRWDQLLEAGSEANARARGILRLEGKEYIVQDGDVLHIRHSG